MNSELIELVSCLEVKKGKREELNKLLNGPIDEGVYSSDKFENISRLAAITSLDGAKKPEPQSIKIGNTVIRKDRIESYTIESEVGEKLEKLTCIIVATFSGYKYRETSKDSNQDLIAQLDEILGV